LVEHRPTRREGDACCSLTVSHRERFSGVPVTDSDDDWTRDLAAKLATEEHRRNHEPIRSGGRKVATPDIRYTPAKAREREPREALGNTPDHSPEGGGRRLDHTRRHAYGDEDRADIAGCHRCKGSAKKGPVSGSLPLKSYISSFGWPVPGFNTGPAVSPM
jgi:hypothetical protein